MIDIPPFEQPNDEERYISIFEDKLVAYTTLMDKVKDSLYGSGFGNYSNLPGTCIQVVEKITTDLINLTSHEYTQTKQNDKLSGFSLGDK